jgi:hypothetical protein
MLTHLCWEEGGGSVIPLVLVSTAHSPGDDPQYIQGAGDDEESWAMGLTPALFWEHHDYILEYSSQDVIEDRIREAWRALFASAHDHSLKMPPHAWGGG